MAEESRCRIAPMDALEQLRFSSAEEMAQSGFPLAASDELTEQEGAAIEQALAAKSPAWLAEYLAQRERQSKLSPVEARP